MMIVLEKRHTGISVDSEPPIAGTIVNTENRLDGDQPRATKRVSLLSGTGQTRRIEAPVIPRKQVV